MRFCCICHLFLQHLHRNLPDLPSHAVPIQRFLEALIPDCVLHIHVELAVTNHGKRCHSILNLKERIVRHTDSFLIFSSTFLLYLVFLLVYLGSYPISDEKTYQFLGLAYVRGIISGDLNPLVDCSIHTFSCVSPPLAKIITGVIAIVLDNFGLGGYPIPTRVHFSLVVALMGVFIFEIGERFGGRILGWLSWLFYLPIPAITSVNYYSIIDATSLFFLLLAFKSLIFGGKCIKGGILYGLSSLSKFVPLPIFPAVVLSWGLYGKKEPEKLLEMLKSVCIGLLVFWLGEPLLWNARFFSQMMEKLSYHGHSLTIWSVPFVHFVEGEQGAIFEIVASMFYTISYPSERFLTINLYVVLILFIYFLASKGKELLDVEVFFLLWAAVTHLFFAVHRIRMWYHDFWVMVPASLFFASVISRLIAERKSSDAATSSNGSSL